MDAPQPPPRRRPGRPPAPGKVTKAYRLPADLVSAYEHLHVDLGRPACSLVERAMRAGLDRLKSELAAAS